MKRSIKSDEDLNGEGALSVEGLPEIVRLEGKLAKPHRVGDLTGEEITVSIKTVGPDLTADWDKLRASGGNQVRIILYALPNANVVDPDQTELGMGGDPEE